MPQDEIIVPDASVRPAVPSAGSSAIPTSPDALGEGGRVPSNRTLPEAPPHQRFACLPPVVDSLHLTFETGVTADFLSPPAMKSPKRQSVSREIGNWVVLPSPGNRGFTGYTHYAMGRGLREDVLVMIGPPTTAANVPSRRKVRVQIGSSVCWKGACKGNDALAIAREVFAALEGDIVTYLAPENEVKVRRVDVCIDHTGYEWSMEDLKRFACRQKSRGVIEDRDGDPSQHSAITSLTGATYYLGKRGGAARLLRIYNKLMEAAASGKLPWMEPIWQQAGWDGMANMWRVEIEHGSEWLSQHGFDSMLKLDGCERELWTHYLQNVRHTCGENTRLKNRLTSPVWQAIGDIAASRPPGTWQWCPRKPKMDTDVRRLIRQSVGCAVAAASALRVAWGGDGSVSLEKVLAAIFEEARRLALEEM